MEAMNLLDVNGLFTSYGRIPMLMNVSVALSEGCACCVLGANGAGKSTLVKAILGMVKADQGSIFYKGQDITAWPTNKRIAAGIQVASAATGTFTKMSVETNLKLGAYNINDPKLLAERLEEIYASFPVLKQRLNQKAGTLSGGERTMLAIARAVINKPSLLIMDEPSLGLAPIVVDEVFRIVRRLNQNEKITIMLVEQNAKKALAVSHAGYIIQKGQIIFSGDTETLKNSEFLENPVM
ncbi:MAG TPA: ABC transporter ATP-binding protein [Clostridiales bacterium]|jgi:branched-chain amino acid transport system ATP-binding protein|nr:ABC transporter ATP-binding protein [Clostridiales bacterium]